MGFFNSFLQGAADGVGVKITAVTDLANRVSSITPEQVGTELGTLGATLAGNAIANATRRDDAVAANSTLSAGSQPSGGPGAPPAGSSAAGNSKTALMILGAIVAIYFVTRKR